MENDQNLTQLGPRIKLFKRHLRESKDLLMHQILHRRLIQEDVDQKSTSRDDTVVGIHGRITMQAMRLTQLMKRQFEERQNMRDRHQQEESYLEQVIKAL